MFATDGHPARRSPGCLVGTRLETGTGTIYATLERPPSTPAPVVLIIYPRLRVDRPRRQTAVSCTATRLSSWRRGAPPTVATVGYDKRGFGKSAAPMDDSGGGDLHPRFTIAYQVDAVARLHEVNRLDINLAARDHLPDGWRLRPSLFRVPRFSLSRRPTAPTDQHNASPATPSHPELIQPC